MRNLIFAPMFSYVMLLATAASADPPLTLQAWVGKQIFFDRDLSINRNQACAGCHGQAVGWTGSDAAANLSGAVYEGSTPGVFGNRKPTSSAYATQVPCFHYTSATGRFAGGEFWDGRATGWKLGNPAADQAQGPFLNPAEQALPSARIVVERDSGSWYAPYFLMAWGNMACRQVDLAYDYIALSIAAFEGSKEVTPFSSKYDAFLAGKGSLTAQERHGLDLFNGKAKCSRCHPSTRRPDGSPPLFTDYSYDNLGVPRNPANPVYGMSPDFVDPGLAGFLQTLAKTSDWRSFPFVSPSVVLLSSGELDKLAEKAYGEQRVPTLRNVAKGLPSPKAFTHNGFFKTLKGLVHFYNTRDALMKACPVGSTEAYALANGCWPPPEVTANLNTLEVGRLSLTAAEEDTIVAFLGTLSDGAMP